jgi:phosphate transport system permease protein
LQIYGDIQQARTVLNTRAWGAALTLVLLILVLNVVARVASRRSRIG